MRAPAMSPLTGHLTSAQAVKVGNRGYSSAARPHRNTPEPTTRFPFRITRPAGTPAAAGPGAQCHDPDVPELHRYIPRIRRVTKRAPPPPRALQKGLRSAITITPLPTPADHHANPPLAARPPP